MKKLLTIALCFVLAFSVCISVSAAQASVSGPTTITEGSTAQFTVSINGCPDATSASVSVSVGENLAVESGTWLIGSLKKFFTDTNKGASGDFSSPDINGSVFKLSVKGVNQSTAPQNIVVTITAKNGANEVFNQTSKISATVTCAVHIFGNFTKVSDTQHGRTCSACGYRELADHSWDSGSIIKAANCRESGLSEHTCIVCGAKASNTLPQTANHTFGAYTVTKAATCTQNGEETATCSTCGKTNVKAVNATGHQFSKWTNEKEPTCTEKGVKKRVCSKCKAEEKQNINALGHDFESPKLIKEATLFSSGILEGKCKRCGKTTQQVTPCSYNDETNGIKIETSEGVFSEGTDIKIEQIENNSEKYEFYKSALAEYSSVFKIYNISAFNGTENVEPNGIIKISFSNVEDLGKEFEVYYIDADGNAVKKEVSVSEDGKIISIESENTGVFAVCAIDAEVSGDKDQVAYIDEENTPKSNTAKIIIIVVSIVIVLCIAGIAAFLIYSKKKRK